MRTKLVALALTGTLGLTGLALVAPGSALAQTADGTPRLTALKDALKGLVTDGTITQSQADEVASTLAEALPDRGHHGGLRGVAKVAQEEVAEALGITVEELRTQREEGKTLAQIAEAEGIEKADLIDDLVTAAKDRLAEAVADGRITQAQADEATTDLEARITEKVDQVGHGPGRKGGRGHHSHGPDGEDAPAATPAPTPSVESSSA